MYKMQRSCTQFVRSKSLIKPQPLKTAISTTTGPRIIPYSIVDTHCQHTVRFYSSVGSTRRQFRDKTTCCITGGKGGDGVATFRREKYVDRGGPDGGDGGKGGTVYVQVFPSVQNRSDTRKMNYMSLSHVGFHQKAENGGDGMSKKRKGKNGEDLIIYVPPGTLVRDVDTGTILADVSGTERTANGELQKFVVAKGGTGGLGNMHFASGSNRSPKEFTLGKPGEQKIVELELKAIADVGLVGYPNAGKSTFLSSISSVTPKIAAYPFTTLHPTVGEIVTQKYGTFTMADIPGLIEGAHANVGLGHDFLRHIERTRMLIYVLDISGMEGMGILRDEETGKLIYQFLDPELEPEVDLTQETPLHLLQVTHEEKEKKRLMETERKREAKAEDDNFLLDYGIIDFDDENDENIRVVRAKKPTKIMKQKKIVKAQEIAIKRVKDVEIQKQKQRELLQQQASVRRRALREFESGQEVEEEEDEDEKKRRAELVRQEIRKNRQNMYVLQPWEVLKKLETELELYMPGLSSNAKLIVANKMDVPGAAKNLEILRKHTNLPIFPVSALKQENLQAVIEYCYKILSTSKDSGNSTGNSTTSSQTNN